MLQVLMLALTLALVEPMYGQQTVIPCLLPEDAIEDLKFSLSFDREFRQLNEAVPKSGGEWAAQLQFTWWNLSLYFFLPGAATAFGYNPDSVRRDIGSQISSIGVILAKTSSLAWGGCFRCR